LTPGGRGYHPPTIETEERGMLTIIESGFKAWAVAATSGDLRVYSREQAGEWIEVALSDDSEQIDQDGSLILEALYEQHIGQEQAESEEPEAEEDEPEPEEDEPEPEEDEPEAEEDEPEQEKPRRSRGSTRARKK
jgi:hypothetical protein